MTPNVNQHLKARPPGRIYHYTSQRGLLGIFTGREIWATKIQYMNDVEEFRHAIQLAETTLENRANILGENPAILHLRKQLSLVESKDIFVACFSEAGDLLSQWRGYCPNGGFSVGFHYEDLERVVSSQQCFVGRCIYDLDMKRKLLEEIVDEFLARAVDEADSDGSSQDFFLNFWILAPLLKEGSFKEENEWRIVSFQRSLKESAIGVREGKSTLVPYLRLKMDTEKHSALNDIEIVVSPNPDMSLALSGVNALLVSSKIRGLAKGSTVPYRAW